MSEAFSDYREDIRVRSWLVTAKHLTRGEENVSKIVADAIWQERQRWVSNICTQDILKALL